LSKILTTILNNLHKGKWLYFMFIVTQYNFGLCDPEDEVT